MPTLARNLSVSFFSLLVFATLAAGEAAAATINVPADQPSIQAAINAASDGDPILVAPGKYVENINFLGKAISVTSSGGPSATTIDGGAAGSVVTFNTQEGPRSVLSGFTITNGHTSYPAYDGGGIYIWHASPTISGNVITRNTACDGGGGIGALESSALIQGNTITNNSQYGCGGVGGAGGYAGGGSIQIIGNTIADNVWRSGDGGGIALNGGANVRVENNTIRGNTATGVSPAAQGGGISIINSAQALIVQNLIFGNSADQGGGISISMS